MHARQNDIDDLIAQLADYRTRSSARKRLHELGQDPAPKLLNVLQDDEQKTNARWAALRLLADTGYQGAQLPILHVARESENLRGEACRALKTLTDQDFGEDLEQWEAFLKGELEPSGSTKQPDTETEFPEQEQQQETSEPRDKCERVPPQQEEFDLIEKALTSRAQEITWEDDYIYLHLPVNSERTHQLILSFTRHTETEQRSANFYTRCGRSRGEEPSLINYCNNRLTYGQAYVETEQGDDVIIGIAETFPVETLDEQTVETVVTTLTQEADQLEDQLTDKDRI